MATDYNNQQTTTTTWVPYQPAKDCSLAVCSSYCPQWCNVILPMPPPALLASGASSARTFSPLVIAVIGFLASAFLLLSYYTIVNKYCGTFSSQRWRLRRRPGQSDDDGGGGLEPDEEAWYVSSPSNGLDESSVGKIAVRKYKRPSSGGGCGGTDCAVCLSEFKEDESLRVLPICSHAFHVRCIDIWLKSHCSCPLCRTDLVSVNSPSQGREPAVVVSVVENPAPDIAQEPGAAMAEGGDAIDIVDDEDFQSLRRSLSMDFSGVVFSSSRWAAPEQSSSSSSSRRLCAMKRSFSSGRLSLTTRHGKGRNAVLPI